MGVIAPTDVCNSALTKGNSSEETQKCLSGVGAVVNCAGIVAGGLAGMLFRSQISHALQENLIRAMGLVCLFLSIFGAMESGVTVTDGGLHAEPLW